MTNNSQSERRVLIVDLNNFATFPTLAVGLLVAGLRDAGFNTEVLTPLSYDVPGIERERKENIFDHWERRLHLSRDPRLLWIRDSARNLRTFWNSRPHPRVLKEVNRALDSRPDIVLISAYLQHYRTVTEIGTLVEACGIPLLLGGPVFNLQKTAEAWLTIPGLTALVGGEVDSTLSSLVTTVIEGKDLCRFDGVMLPDGRCSVPAAPLTDISIMKVPDFTDFPWERYRVRVIPVMAARGCQWGQCKFCSDVHIVNSRLFRFRTAELVLNEMKEQGRRHQTRNFLLLDLKLNSNPVLWRGIIEGIQQRIPGAQWIGTVHVDTRKDNGLSEKDLCAAVTSGMRRISFGLESGSQRLLNAMRKGTTVEGNARFIRAAYSAGLSIRSTMFCGYPGETADDLEQTADFLQEHGEHIDRVRFNDLSIHEGSPLYDEILADAALYPGIKIIDKDHINSRLRFRETRPSSKEYKQALRKILRIVYLVNKKTIRSDARVFDGLM